MEKYAVIMAGGAGKRLWPLSKNDKPKQFISVDGNKPFLVQTIERICELIPVEKCFVITNKDYLKLTEETLKDLIPTSNIIIEPLKKNTAACISYATLYLEKMFGKGLVCFIPADSYVKNKVDYQQAISKAYQAAESSKELVIIGVKPSYPATGFGYIQLDSKESFDLKDISTVVSFKEKPNMETAREYVESEKYLWNSGIVAGQLQTFMTVIQQYLPQHYEQLSVALTDHTSQFPSIIEHSYNQLQDLSFDYGVLEKNPTLLAVRGNFDWYDIGSLDALSIPIGKDSNNNSIHGKHLGIETNNSIIYSKDHLITTIGLSDMVVVNVGDSIIVCPKERAQDVKMIVDLLEKNGYEKYL